jgi:hypothetical protein
VYVEYLILMCNFIIRRFCGLTFSQSRLVEGFSIVCKNVMAFIFIKLNAAVNIPSKWKVYSQNTTVYVQKGCIFWTKNQNNMFWRFMVIIRFYQTLKIANPYTNLKKYYLSNWRFTHTLYTQQLYMTQTWCRDLLINTYSRDLYGSNLKCLIKPDDGHEWPKHVLIFSSEYTSFLNIHSCVLTIHLPLVYSHNGDDTLQSYRH